VVSASASLVCGVAVFLASMCFLSCVCPVDECRVRDKSCLSVHNEECASDAAQKRKEKKR
jgi:hypothetical protein